jgi:hydroxymethylglutaryl-CoA lyase
VSPQLPSAVTIRDVGPRDGLQVEAPVPPQSRARIVQSLLDAGIRHVEAVSFVSPKAVPSMSEPEEVLRSLVRPPGVVIAGLVPNVRGAELALEAQVDEITVTVAASPAYNMRNVRMTIDQSVEAIGTICKLAVAESVAVDAVISCAFGSPYEGDIDPEEVAALAGRLRRAGASAITLADTTGMATPRVLAEALSAIRKAIGEEVSIGLHMHETRGTGLVNCYSAMEEGISRFDTSVGGLGGSPFAAQAAGNVSTEDLVALLDDLGISTGIDLDRLLEASSLTERTIGHVLSSRVAYAGARLPPG